MTGIVEEQRRAAFAAFDLDGSGLIAQIDVRYAFQACDGIGMLVAEKDIMLSARRCNLKQGDLVSYDNFHRMADIVEEFNRPRKEMSAVASRVQEQDYADEMEAAQVSPRRCTRSVPPADHYTMGEDFAYLRGPVHENPPAPLPTSPRVLKARLTEEGLDAVENAFYLFDTDFSGAISGVELPAMMALVPRGTVVGRQWTRVSKEKCKTLARPSGDSKAAMRQQKHWDDQVVRALSLVGKQYGSMMNIHEFQLVVDVMDPPPPPAEPDPADPAIPAGETESQRRRRLADEEAARREQEEHEAWERGMAATLVVKLEREGSYIKLLECDSEDVVSTILEKLAAQTGRLPADMRLVGNSYELDSRKKLSQYHINVGMPWQFVPPGGPFVWVNGDVLSLMWREAEADEENQPVTGWLQVALWDGSMLQVWCEEDEPIEHIQRRLAEQIQVAPSQQRLVVHGREMNGRQTMKDYDVILGDQGDIVDVLLRDFPAEPRLAYGSPPRVN